MLLLAKFWDTWEIYINFLKLYIMIAKLHTRFEDCTTFYSNTKSDKKDFLPPLNLTEKWLTYQKKPIRQSQWLKFHSNLSNVLMSITRLCFLSGKDTLIWLYFQREIQRTNMRQEFCCFTASLPVSIRRFVELYKICHINFTLYLWKVAYQKICINKILYTNLYSF